MINEMNTTFANRTLYNLLCFVAVAVVCGRILGRSQPRFGDNETSLQATVRALVDHGTYAIGHRYRDRSNGDYFDTGIITGEGWNTIDKVLRPDTQDFCSGKNALLATLMAGEYWCLQKAFDWRITSNNMEVVRMLLLTFNALPLIVYLVLFRRLVESMAVTPWTQFYVLLAACFGTYLTTFTITLNNHDLAAYSALFALYPFLQLYSESVSKKNTLETTTQRSPTWPFVFSGFFAGILVCMDPPAATFALALFLLLIRGFPWHTLTLFVPAATTPIIALMVTNYLAFGQISPGYRDPVLSNFEGGNWTNRTDLYQWYLYSETMDESKWEYAFHFLEGHHGIFSLSPIYLLSFAGMLFGPTGIVGQRDCAVCRDLKLLTSLTLVLSLVILAFYLIATSNYGGGTSGPRWLIWLTPFWLLVMIPVLDRLAVRPGGRLFATVLLIISVCSASYPQNDPWSDPWLYRLLQYLQLL